MGSSFPPVHPDLLPQADGQVLHVPDLVEGEDDIGIRHPQGAEQVMDLLLVKLLAFFSLKAGAGPEDALPVLADVIRVAACRPAEQGNGVVAFLGDDDDLSRVPPGGSLLQDGSLGVGFPRARLPAYLDMLASHPAAGMTPFVYKTLTELTPRDSLGLGEVRIGTRVQVTMRQRHIRSGPWARRRCRRSRPAGFPLSAGCGGVRLRPRPGTMRSPG